MFSNDKFEALMKELNGDTPKPAQKSAPKTKKYTPPGSSKRTSASGRSADLHLGDWADRLETLESKLQQKEKELQRTKQEFVSQEKQYNDLQRKLIVQAQELKLLTQQNQQLQDATRQNPATKRVKELVEKLTSAEKLWQDEAEKSQVMAQKYRASQIELQNAKQQLVDLQTQHQQDMKRSSSNSLLALLQSRGLHSAEEQIQALKGILDKDKSASFLSDLQLSEGGRGRSVIDTNIRLVWDEAPDVARLGAVTVDVGAERCEITGGHDLLKAGRRFLDGFIIHGLKNGVIFTQNRTDLHVLQKIVLHHSVDLRLETIQDDNDISQRIESYKSQQVVILWSNEESDSLRNTVKSLATHHMICSSERTLGAFLVEVGEQLLAL